jgi:catechol 2,3-dioxygenase-like lactoylglutathione lyase family enzyme
MNTEIIVHPKLQHVGLTTPNLSALLDWYRETIGLTVKHLVKVPPGLPNPPPFTAVAFASNDEVNHRISIFEIPGLFIDRERLRHAKVQHVAFTYRSRHEFCEHSSINLGSLLPGGYRGLRGPDTDRPKSTGLPSRPREFHLEPLESGREPLDSSGSCHRAKAAAFHCSSGSSCGRSPDQLAQQPQVIWQRNAATGEGR